MASVRPEHLSAGDPCTSCGLPSARHRVRVRPPRVEYRRDYRIAHPSPTRSARIIGVDGEGSGRRPHSYTYLAACDELERSRGISAYDAPQGILRIPRLTSYQCLDFLVSLPDRALVVGFAILYDLTKILQDLPNDKLYYLFHERTRAVLRGKNIVYRSVHWEGFRLNYMNRCFTVSRGKKTVTLWDVFAFYQGKFTTALKDWKAAPATMIADIEAMKNLRGGPQWHDQPRSAIENYCKKECFHLAGMVRKLLDAHKAAGLKLIRYYGAGSSASALLTVLDVKHKRGQHPDEMKDPLARSFFGGRFENSHVGPVTSRCYNADISSAYPYQATQLPCLVHGTWNHCHNPSDLDLENARLALIHWTVPRDSLRGILKIPGWGGLPVRGRKGNIAFPIGGKGGWTWKDEFLAARRLQPATRCDSAWLYHTHCDCQPFRDIYRYYLERVRIGKEGPGIVLKLALNAIYGKLAQSRGLNPPYQCWIWASNITSGCRAQLLEAILSVENPWDILMLATDGVWSRIPLTLPKPRDTGTFCVEKPLGGWEHKSFPDGVMCVRPGIYFPINPTEEQLKEVRARGVGKKSLYDNWHLVTEAWEAGSDTIQLPGVTRFVGAKSAITKSSKGFNRSPDYGEWIDWPTDVSFKPGPKRTSVMLPSQRLKPWTYLDWESEPYDAAAKSAEGIALMQAEIIASEQPDCEFGDVG